MSVSDVRGTAEPRAGRVVRHARGLCRHRVRPHHGGAASAGAVLEPLGDRARDGAGDDDPDDRAGDRGPGDRRPGRTEHDDGDGAGPAAGRSSGARTPARARQPRVQPRRDPRDRTRDGTRGERAHRRLRRSGSRRAAGRLRGAVPDDRHRPGPRGVARPDGRLHALVEDHGRRHRQARTSTRRSWPTSCGRNQSSATTCSG